MDEYDRCEHSCGNCPGCPVQGEPDPAVERLTAEITGEG